jgi:hypothetical protein
MQTPEHIEEQSRDQQAWVRMEDEGCPNGRTARLPMRWESPETPKSATRRNGPKWSDTGPGRFL